MLSFLSQIQLLNLSGLLLAIAAPLLIFAYLKTKNKDSILVSSTFILEQLSKKPVIKSRVKPPLRFFFELLALLLLCLAATSPIWSSKDGNVAIVIDNSLSMATRLAKGQSQTRFDKAKEIALAKINSLSSNTTVNVFSIAPQTKMIGAKDSTREQAKYNLEKLKIFPSDASLNNSIEGIVESKNYDSLLAISDYKSQKKTNKPDLKKNKDKDLSNAETKIEYTSVSSTAPNFFISEASIVQPSISNPGSKKIRTLVSFSGQGNPTVQISLYNVSLADQSKKLIRKKSFTFTSEQEEVFFQLQGEKSPLYKVEIGDSSNVFDNANLLDDQAWISENATKQTSALLVTQNKTRNNLGLSNISGLSFISVTPGEYARLNSKQIDSYTFIIFHRSAPARLPEKSSLVILPPDNNVIFPVIEEVKEPKITSWSGEHPVTSYLKVNLINAGNSVIFKAPSWSSTVINSEFGSLLVAGEKAGIRLAASGMELLPFEGSATPSISVLTLNLINWLKKDTSLKSQTLTGSQYQNSKSETTVVITPKGSIEKIKPRKTFTFEEPGAYLITGNKDSKNELLISNTFFPSESNTANIQEINLPEIITRSTVARESKNQIWKYLIYIGLGFLLIEFFLRVKKKKETT